MYKIAVIGSPDTVIGFKALGLDAFPIRKADEARTVLRQLTKTEEQDDIYSIIYLEEALASELTAEIARFKDSPTPAIILIPGKDGSLGLGRRALEEAVERAVGANIL